jgi:hypothetical protein
MGRADSKGHDLPEPSKEKVVKLVELLKQKTKMGSAIELKRNLNRILMDLDNG